MNQGIREEEDGVFAARLGQGLREIDGRDVPPDVAASVLDALAGQPAATPRSAVRFVTVLAALLAVAVVATLLWQRSSGGLDGTDDDARAALQDPTPATGATRLVYELPAVTAPEKVVDALRRRLDGKAKVEYRGGARIEVDVDAAAGVGRLEQVRALIEGKGQFEMRVLADADYIRGGVRFDMQTEHRRVQEWLDGGGRTLLVKDRRAIAGFRPDSEHLRWVVHVIRPIEGGDRWGMRLGDVPALGQNVVAAYADDDWNDGVVPEAVRAQPREQQSLIELVAVNQHERHFRETDFQSFKLRENLMTGESSLEYRVRDALAGDYADFSEAHIGKHCAMLWNGELLSAPQFMSRIPGRGQIAGLSAATVDLLARVLSTPFEAELTFRGSMIVGPGR